MQPDTRLSSEAIQVWVLEDNDNYRDAVTGFVEAGDGLACPHSFRAGEELLAFAKVNPHPQVLLADIELPGISGLEVIEELVRRRKSKTRCLVLTVYKDVDLIFDSVRSGASGYLLKNPSRSIRDVRRKEATPAQEICRAIHDVHSGGGAMSGEVIALMSERIQQQSAPVHDYGFTEKEMEVLILWASPEDMSKKAIARKLDRSPHTIDTHMRNILRKMDARTGKAAAVRAVLERIVTR